MKFKYILKVFRSSLFEEPERGLFATLPTPWFFRSVLFVFVRSFPAVSPDLAARLLV